MRLSTPFKLTASSWLDIFSIAFSMEEQLLAIILAFSLKKPPLLSLSLVISSEPVAIVLIVSEIVFFGFLAFSLS